MNGKILLGLGVMGAVAWYLFKGNKPAGTTGTAFNPFRTTGTAAAPNPFGFRPANAGGYGLPATRGGSNDALGAAFGVVGRVIDRFLAGSSTPRGGPNQPDIVEGPGGVYYRNTGNAYVPYVDPRNHPSAADYAADPGLGAGLSFGAEPDFSGSVESFDPDFGGGYAPATGFDSIDTSVAEGLA